MKLHAFKYHLQNAYACKFISICVTLSECEDSESKEEEKSDFEPIWPHELEDPEPPLLHIRHLLRGERK